MTMTREEYLDFIKTQFQVILSTIEIKSHDYAGADGGDPFGNYRMGASLLGAPTSHSVFMRLAEKVSRLATHLRDGALLGESVEDACLDVVGHTLALHAILRMEAEEEYPPIRPVEGVEVVSPFDPLESDTTYS